MFRTVRWRAMRRLFVSGYDHEMQILCLKEMDTRQLRVRFIAQPTLGGTQWQTAEYRGRKHALRTLCRLMDCDPTQWLPLTIERYHPDVLAGQLAAAFRNTEPIYITQGAQPGWYMVGAFAYVPDGKRLRAIATLTYKGISHA